MLMLIFVYFEVHVTFHHTSSTCFTQTIEIDILSCLVLYMCRVILC